MAIIAHYKNVFTKEWAKEVVDDIDKREGWEYYSFVPQRLKLHFDQWPVFEEMKHTILKRKAEQYDVTGFFVRYDPGTECLEHVDSSLFSVVSFLQKPTVGGDLYVNGQRVELEVGDVVVFHGSDLHYAEPVVEGMKFSFVMFLNQKGYWDKQYEKMGKRPSDRIGEPVPVRI